MLSLSLAFCEHALDSPGRTASGILTLFIAPLLIAQIILREAIPHGLAVRTFVDLHRTRGITPTKSSLEFRVAGRSRPAF